MPEDSPSHDYTRFSALKFKGLQNLRRRLQIGLIRLFLACAARLTVGMSQRMGRWTARMIMPFMPRERAICDYQLELVYPHMHPRERKRLAMRMFENLGMTLWEMLAMPRIRREADHWLHLEGGEVMQEAHAEGKGVILVTGHMANWELLSIAFQRLRVPAQAVARTLANEPLNEIVIEHRESDYLRVVQRGSKDSARQLLSCLKNGDALILVVDHDVEVPGVFVNFFGMPANTPRVVASLALRLGAPVVTGFDRRLPDGTHVMRFTRVPPPKGIRNNAEGIRQYTQKFNDAIEAHIRECPEQWTWNHRRWKRQPSQDAEQKTGG